MEWKWSQPGEAYERSRRQPREVVKPQRDAYSDALMHDENSWDQMNAVGGLNGFRVSNKREELDNKMSDRMVMQQTGFNPFFQNHSYVDDIAVQDQFLVPVNTTQGETRVQGESRVQGETRVQGELNSYQR